MICAFKFWTQEIANSLKSCVFANVPVFVTVSAAKELRVAVSPAPRMKRRKFETAGFNRFSALFATQKSAAGDTRIIRKNAITSQAPRKRRGEVAQCVYRVGYAVRRFCAVAGVSGVGFDSS